MEIKNLITNQDVFLEEVINNTIPASKNLYFLVGYFYFSGFEKLYKNIQDKHLKILVGMDIEQDIQNKIKEVELIEKVNLARGEVRNNFYQSLVRLFNNTDFFDSKEKQEAFRVYLSKIKDGSLEIRKTKEPNHAKMYLFEHTAAQSHGGRLPGTLITGSSNLSRSGLKDRLEINVILRDHRDYIEGKELFDQLWKSAVDIADLDNKDDFYDEVVEKIWVDKLYKPYYFYVRVLDELFSKKKERRLKYPSEISNERYFNLKYQVDAIDSAISKIEQHGGVIISDVVGLGKSIVASVVSYNLGLKTIIVAPPHLIEQWETYRWDFDFNAKVYSSGKIETAVEENKDNKELLIIIDEAHKYRNENTITYAHLHRLCQGNKVILLTATPFSNRPQDIFSMIKLFQIPAKSTIQTVENLSIEFKRLIIEYKKIQESQKKKIDPPEVIKKRIKDLADEIRNILSPLIIRRTRLDLIALEPYRDDLKAQGIAFPKVLDPIPLAYDMGNLSQLYLDTLEKIAPEDEEKGFLGARYKPVIYLKDFKKYRDRITQEFGEEQLFRQSQVNVAKFMRRLLVARFESSIFAFKKSLEQMIESSKIMIKWFDDAGLVPIFKRGYIPDVESLTEDVSGALSEEFADMIFEKNIEKLRQKGFEFIPANELKVAFKKDIEKDITLLESIKEQWFKHGIKHDPKLSHFKTTAKNKIEKEPQRKLVVFTTYADTANYLYDHLIDTFRVFKYTGSDATQENKRIIKENFDAGWAVQKDDFDILVATDAISEGYNLHRAGAIFNYDIPFNPTRVIQRVGRINRINKKVFDELYIYNFFPTDIGEEEVGMKRISTLKKAMIDALLGEDTKVLTSEEELDSYFARKFRQELEDQEELSWDTRHLNLLEHLKKAAPDVIEKAQKIPTRSRIQRSEPKDIKGVMVFGRKGNDYVFKHGIDNMEVNTIKTKDALDYFEAEVSEEPRKVSAAFEDIYQNVKANLFTKKSQIPFDKGRRDATNKLLLIKEKIPHKKDYIEDLIFVIQKLDALPERFARMIRSLSMNKLDQEFNELGKAIPHRYLINIVNTARKVEEGVECLIFAEEFI
jgi:superfamily II DNA or RNA helicase